MEILWLERSLRRLPKNTPPNYLTVAVKCKIHSSVLPSVLFVVIWTALTWWVIWVWTCKLGKLASHDVCSDIRFRFLPFCMKYCRILDCKKYLVSIWQYNIFVCEKNWLSFHHQRLLKKFGDNSTGGHAPYRTDYYVGNSRTEEITPLEADVLTHCWEPTKYVRTLSLSSSCR